MVKHSIPQAHPLLTSKKGQELEQEVHSVQKKGKIQALQSKNPLRPHRTFFDLGSENLLEAPSKRSPEARGKVPVLELFGWRKHVDGTVWVAANAEDRWTVLGRVGAEKKFVWGVELD
eukprot:g1139.t1